MLADRLTAAGTDPGDPSTAVVLAAAVLLDRYDAAESGLGPLT